MPSANTTKIALMFTVAVAVAIIAALSVSLYSVQSQAQEQPSDPENNVSFRDNEVRLVAAAADIEKRINESIRVMRLTSELAQVRSTDYLDSIRIEHMGISEDKDIEKRTVARQVLSQHAEFSSIFFLTPDEDIYLGEHFEQQEQLPRLNYADRDWYKGVKATNGAYVSSVFMSLLPLMRLPLP